MTEQTFDEDLEKWIMYFDSTRQVGHTHAALHGVKNNPKSLLVCAHNTHKKLIGKQGISIGDSIIGKSNPVVFDNYTVYTILVKSLKERIDKQKIRDAIDESLEYQINNVRCECKANYSCKACSALKNLKGMLGL